MKTAWTFTLAAPTPSLNVTQRMHPQARKRQQIAWGWEIKAGLLPALPGTLERARVTVWRHSVGELDADNLAGGCKDLIDVLKPVSPRNPCGLGLIADDKPACLSVEYRQVKAANRREQKTVVRIEPA